MEKKIKINKEKPPSLLTPTASLQRFEQDPNYLHFNNLLERLVKLTESCHTHGYGLLKEKDTD